MRISETKQNYKDILEALILTLGPPQADGMIFQFGRPFSLVNRSSMGRRGYKKDN